MDNYFKFTYVKELNRMRIESDSPMLYSQIIDVFTVPNPQFFYLERRGITNADESLSVITPTGTFRTGMFISIHKAALSIVKDDTSRIIIDNDTKKSIIEECKPLNGLFNGDYEIEEVDSSRPLRYYQREAVEKLLKYGKGICVSVTGSGKSLIICTLINELRKNSNRIKYLSNGEYYLIVVPTRQLVDQMYKDLTEYGLKNICMWTSNSGKKSDGSFKDNSCSNGFENIIITNHAWINKEIKNKNKNFPIKSIGCVIADEVHTVGYKTEILKNIEKINPKLRFGFTGTLPSSIFNKWIIIGSFGIPVYSNEIKQFQDEGFLSKIKIHPIRGVINELEHTRKYIYGINHSAKLGDILPDGTMVDTGTALSMENEFFDTNCLELYSPMFDKVLDSFDYEHRNMIVLFDRLNIGKTIYDILTKKVGKSANVYYTDGSIDISKREEIRSTLESTNGNILVAQSVTASVGLNIKNLNGIVFAFSGKSYVRVIQSIGRVIRLKNDGSDSDLFELYFNTRYSDQHHNEKMKIFESQYGRDSVEKIEVVNI